ncbi:MAG: hypothetical protein VB076_06560 [Synergistaceae bacterium]|nr:hypothetical protein [Synergistaceae bacterium]
MPTYTTSTVMSTVPLEITFTCAHCGNTVSTKKYIRLEGQIAVKGYGPNSDKVSAQLAQNQMTRTADDKVRQAAEQLERGRLSLPLQEGSAPRQMSIAVGLTCPHCGIHQIPDAGCKRWRVSRKSYFLAQGALAILWMIVCFIILAPSHVEPMGLLYAICGYIAAALLLIFRRNQLSKRAYADPVFMAQYFHYALNADIYADFTPCGLGRIHVGAKK